MIRSLILWLAMIAAACGMLYHTSYEVNALQATLAKTQKAIESEREAMRVLDAEWAYVSAPARVDKLARRALNMQPARATQIMTLAQMDARLPRALETTQFAQTQQPSPTTRTQTAALDSRH